ncbi:hypothetical protein IWZ03DRAFT_364534 [Phyllosticta citriasiana]|uniref:Uncharacterized protein n=1 Tax=Phyllosticta citriasiana TaxID=595635 RepID=A0ABR1KX15_9PEZI
MHKVLFRHRRTLYGIDRKDEWDKNLQRQFISQRCLACPLFQQKLRVLNRPLPVAYCGYDGRLQCTVSCFLLLSTFHLSLSLSLTTIPPDVRAKPGNVLFLVLSPSKIPRQQPCHFPIHNTEVKLKRKGIGLITIRFAMKGVLTPGGGKGITVFSLQNHGILDKQHTPHQHGKSGAEVPYLQEHGEEWE